MLIGSSENPYKKLLEAEDQFFDFPSNSLSFQKDYSEYKKYSSFYDKEKYINSEYSGFEEDGGIVKFLSECIIGFFNLLGKKIDNTYEQDQSFIELEDNFTYNHNLTGSQQSQADQEIIDFLKLEYSNLRIKGINTVLREFFNDTPDIISSIKLSLQSFTDDLVLTYFRDYGYENIVSLEDDDSIEVNGYDISLSDFREYLEEDEELMNFVLDRGNNKYIQGSYDNGHDSFDSHFVKKIKDYVLHKITDITDYIMIGDGEYPVTINKNELSTLFEKYLDENDIEYDYIKLEDNSIWEEE